MPIKLCGCDEVGFLLCWYEYQLERRNVMKRIVTSVCCFMTVAFACVAMASDKGTLLFGVNEGTSGSSDFHQMQEKYSRLLAHLGGELKSPMHLESATDLKNLTTSLKKSRFDFLLVRPSHISAKAMRDQKYVLVAAAKGDARTLFIVRKDSPLKTPAEDRKSNV